MNNWWLMPAFILATGLGALVGGFIAFRVAKRNRTLPGSNRPFYQFKKRK